jgi:hypothetical protein
MSQFYLFIYCKCMSLTRMLDSIRLNLAVRQVQGSLGLAHVRDPICLDLVVS